MDDKELEQRLSRMKTSWGLVFQANQGREAVSSAQRVLMERYCGAVYRYLLGILRDPDLADDLSQDFALRFLRGDFRQVDPRRGRFRDFLKTALRHLAIDAHRCRQARPRTLPADAVEVAAPAEDPADLDRQFLESWRHELLARAWEALERIEREGGQPWHTVLRLKAEHPELRSAQAAEQLAGRLGRPVTAEWFRKTLERARCQFADSLLEDVERSLDEPTAEQLEEELLDLGLLEYCRPALERRARGR